MDKKSLKDPQMIVAIAAIVLSVCGLSVAIYEASLERRAHEASVWPHIEVSASLRNDRVRIWVRNSGLGPAQVETAAVSIDGSVVGSWSDVIGALLPVDTQVSIYQSYISARVLAPSESGETIFEVTHEASPVIDMLQAAIMDRKLDVEVCYCSVYGACWMSRMQDVFDRARDTATVKKSEQLNSCAAAPRSRI